MSMRNGGACWPWRTHCWVPLRMASAGAGSQALLVRLGACGAAPGTGRVQEPPSWSVLLQVPPAPLRTTRADGRQHPVGQLNFFLEKNKWLQDLGLLKLPDFLLSEGRCSLLRNGWWSAFSKGILQDQRIIGQEEPPTEAGRSPWSAEQPQGPRAGLLCLGLCVALPEMRGPFTFLERPRTPPCGKVFLLRVWLHFHFFLSFSFYF